MMRRLVCALLCAAILPLCAGCGKDNSLPPEVTEAPDYGKKSTDLMKSMYGAPGAKKKAAPAAP